MNSCTLCRIQYTGRMTRMAIPGNASQRHIGVSMAHKLDLGFMHHALLATDPRNAQEYTCSAFIATRAGSGSRLGFPARDVLTCSVRRGNGSEVVMRCLPVEDNGVIDLGNTDLIAAKNTAEKFEPGYAVTGEPAVAAPSLGNQTQEDQQNISTVAVNASDKGDVQQQWPSGDSSQQDHTATPSQPANDPGHIKEVVQDETLHHGE